MDFTLWHGDCLEEMSRIEDGSIDLIVTSPFYNCRKVYGVFDDQIPWPDYYAFMGKFLDQSYRVLRLGGVIAIVVPGVVRWQFEHRYAHTWADYDPSYTSRRFGQKVTGKGRIEPVGFNLFEMMRQRDSHAREPIVWIKGSKEGEAICTSYKMGCDSDPYMRAAHEMIFLGSKGQWFHRGGTGRRGAEACPFMDYTRDVWFISPESHKEHPAIFPVEIPRRLIQIFVHAPNSVILDPFSGTGTTGVAALSLGYKYIGIEQLEKYHLFSSQRLARVAAELRGELNHLPMFAEVA